MNEFRNLLWSSSHGCCFLVSMREKKSVRVEIYQKSYEKLARIHTETNSDEILKIVVVWFYEIKKNDTDSDLPKKRHRNARFINLCDSPHIENFTRRESFYYSLVLWTSLALKLEKCVYVSYMQQQTLLYKINIIIMKYWRSNFSKNKTKIWKRWSWDKVHFFSQTDIWTNFIIDSIIDTVRYLRSLRVTLILK